MSYNYHRNDPPASGGSGHSSSSATARKFTIKPFRSYTQMDSSSALSTFASLSSAMDEIHYRNASTLSFEELYRHAYNLVLHKHGLLLYEGVQDRLVWHLRQSGRKLVEIVYESGIGMDGYCGGLGGERGNDEEGSIGGGGGATTAAAAASSTSVTTTSSTSANNPTTSSYKLLEQLCTIWSEHRITMIMIRDILMYMDRTFVPQHRKRPVYDLGLWLFRKVVWERSVHDLDDLDDDDDEMGGDMEMMDQGRGQFKSNDAFSHRHHRHHHQQQQQLHRHHHQQQHHPPLLLGTVASNLILQAIHQDRLDRLEDAPQRMTLLRDLIHMLLELAHASSSSSGGVNAGQYNDSSIRGGGGAASAAAGGGGGGGAGGGNGGGIMDCIPVYERDFEEVFLGETQDFYRRESTSRLSHSVGILESTSSNNLKSDDIMNDGKPAAKYSAMEYVHRAQARLEEEKARAALLELPTQTKSALLRIVETELIERHAKTLVDMEGSGFACILKVVASSPAVGSVAAAAAAAAAAASSASSSGGASSNNRLLNNMAGGIDSSESGVVIDRERISDLAAMYDLFSRVPSSVNHLRDALSERIRLDGRALVRDQETNVSPPAAFVKGVLDMRERFHAVVSTAMRGEKKAQKRMSEAFEDFLNADARAANCLAVYVDELLRVGLRGADERQVARELDRVIVIFRYLADKDVFEAYYKNHLAKRLLGNKSGSEEAERAMVSLLKAECGYQFTSKLEGMFNDMRISKETAEKYRSHKKMLANASPDARDAENGGKPVDVDVNVLSNSHWPSQNVQQCVLPTAVMAAMDRFKSYYLTTYTGRKLSWQTSTGSAEIRASFPPVKGSTKPRRHDLNVTTYQMCILVLFNTRDTYTLKEIRDETQIPEDELRRHLVSLCTPKHRLLRKGSKGKGISGDDDTFTYNAEFTSKMTRVKIPMVSMRDATGAAAGSAAASGAEEADGSATAATAAVAASNRTGLVDGSAAVPISVEEDRRHLLEAAIVRIMKARKVLNHNDLVAEVTRQLSGRFVPPPQFVKKRVESLIEREYLERDEHDRRVYRYMA